MLHFTLNSVHQVHDCYILALWIDSHQLVAYESNSELGTICKTIYKHLADGKAKTIRITGDKIIVFKTLTNGKRLLIFTKPLPFSIEKIVRGISAHLCHNGYIQADKGTFTHKDNMVKITQKTERETEVICDGQNEYITGGYIDLEQSNAPSIDILPDVLELIKNFRSNNERIEVTHNSLIVYSGWGVELLRNTYADGSIALESLRQELTREIIALGYQPSEASPCRFEKEQSELSLHSAEWLLLILLEAKPNQTTKK